ncbi:MAG TPA: patatin [Sedimenticola thiotaurini]|uniref:Patatin n=1 Tax=Sedimenticola thiotaurini TaxID=1543721 RepID=A0A831RLD8_9GAMM|nr:patatin [Sedimenticola thiotaurini]
MTDNGRASSPDSRADPRIGIALGSGAARGWSHIGVLRALEAMGIYPGIVAGSSIGALVGAAYAGGQLDRFQKWVESLGWRDILAYLDLSPLGGGFIQGERILAFATSHVGDVDIASLPLSFGAVATELSSGREVWLREGSLLDSIRASVALPGLFAPSRLGDRWLVDGGLVDPVPVSLCRAMGAEVVIAVNLNGDIVGKHLQNHARQRLGRRREAGADTDLWSRISRQLSKSFGERNARLLSELLGEERGAPGLFDVLATSINIMQDRITRSRMAGDPPEILLTPRLSWLGLMEFDEAGVAIEEGRASVERMRPLLEHTFDGF